MQPTTTYYVSQRLVRTDKSFLAATHAMEIIIQDIICLHTGLKLMLMLMVNVGKAQAQSTSGRMYRYMIE